MAAGFITFVHCFTIMVDWMGNLKLMLLVLYLWMIQIHYCNPIFSEHSPQELASLSVV